MTATTNSRFPILWNTPSAPGSKHARALRVGIASSASIGGAVVMRMWDDSPPAALWIPAAMLALSALLVHHAAVGSQLIARSVWWANFVLGSLLSLGFDGSGRLLGFMLAICAGSALLVMGRLGLDEQEGSAFRPVAFRNTLMFGMVMAVADAQALLLFAAFELQEPNRHDPRGPHAGPALLFASAALVIVSIVGLYRLRVWGLLLGAVTAAGIGALALVDLYGLGEPAAQSLAITSAIQLLLPIPIVVAIVRRRAPEPSRSTSRLARVVPALVILSLLGASAVRFYLRSTHPF